MEFKLIDKTLYYDIAPKSFDIANYHIQSRPDILNERKLMTKKEFKKRIKIKGFIGLAAYEGDVLCGYCFCRIKNFSSKIKSNNKLLWIDEFYICEQFRKNGYGTKLFREIERIAKENSCSLIEFDVWSFNETAQRFYDSLGCKNQAIKKGYIL